MTQDPFDGSLGGDCLGAFDLLEVLIPDAAGPNSDVLISITPFRTAGSSHTAALTGAARGPVHDHDVALARLRVGGVQMMLASRVTVTPRTAIDNGIERCRSASGHDATAVAVPEDRHLRERNGHDERREVVNHIERARALFRATKDIVHKAVLADMIRYLEGRLKDLCVSGVRADARGLANASYLRLTALD